VTGHSKDEIKDLEEYLKPEITLTSGFGRSRRRMLDKIISYEAIHLEEVEDYELRNLDDVSILILRDQSCVEELKERSKILNDQKPVVLTDLIKEEIDESNFEYRLKNTAILDHLSSFLDDYKIISTKMETGKKQHYKHRSIHGLGPCFDRNGVKIPFIHGSKTIKIRSFPAERVGLSAVPGLGEKFSTVLENRGIQDRRALKDMDPKNLMKEDGIGPYRCTKWISAAEAIEEEDVFRIQKNDLIDKHRIYLDIETDSLRPSIVWHIGIYDDDKEEYFSFLEKDPERNGRIIRKFGKYLKENRREKTVLLAWYGSGFDFKVLNKFFERYGQRFLNAWNGTEKVDLMKWVNKKAVTYCRTSKLEDVAECLGYKREGKSMELDGEEVAKMYVEYMTGESKKPDWDILRSYAKDDVLSLKHIYKKISEAPLKYDLDEMKKKYRNHRF